MENEPCAPVRRPLSEKLNEERTRWRQEIIRCGFGKLSNYYTEPTPG
jgi:hypothetical protein